MIKKIIMACILALSVGAHVNAMQPLRYFASTVANNVQDAWSTGASVDFSGEAVNLPQAISGAQATGPTAFFGAETKVADAVEKLGTAAASLQRADLPAMQGGGAELVKTVNSVASSQPWIGTTGACCIGTSVIVAAIVLAEAKYKFASDAYNSIKSKYLYWKNRPREASFRNVYDKLCTLLAKYNLVHPYLDEAQQGVQRHDIENKINALNTKIQNLTVMPVSTQEFNNFPAADPVAAVQANNNDFCASLRPLMTYCLRVLTWSEFERDPVINDQQKTGNNNLIKQINIQIAALNKASEKAIELARAREIPLAGRVIPDAALPNNILAPLAAVPAGAEGVVAVRALPGAVPVVPAAAEPRPSTWKQAALKTITIAGIFGAIGIAYNGCFTGPKMNLKELFTGISPLHTAGFYGSVLTAGIAKYYNRRPARQ